METKAHYKGYLPRQAIAGLKAYPGHLLYPIYSRLSTSIYDKRILFLYWSIYSIKRFEGFGMMPYEKTRSYFMQTPNYKDNFTVKTLTNRREQKLAETII